MPILRPHPYREIAPVDVERDRNVLGMQIRARGVAEPSDLAACQDQPAHGRRIAVPPLQPVAQMQSAQFVLVGPLDAVIAHRHQRDGFGAGCQRPRRRRGGHQRRGVEPFRPRCGDNTLGARAGPLDDRLAAEIDRRYLERRVAEVETVRRDTTHLAHADLPDAAVAQGERLRHRPDHDDPRRAVGQRDRRGGEGAKHIDDGDRTLGLPSAFEQAADRDLHCRLLMAWP